ncbi:MAG: ribosome recycling factor [Candidatus Berkelbacteria bacterium Gr01-1014_85]|uniref:Ribosome recycling factor n=1 Tax=Candidatus Berkelbacteria bacterium Gr01-1014_85 TaxID=2017150 RepID=A0A554JDU2_9BACT|nr:MAG: ribosome recycling factor [Candidatus Berkelbacteria bacterium Gr01-1014_85]
MNHQPTKVEFQALVDELGERLKTIQTGRATAMLVEDIQVMQYGQPMSLKSVATLSVPEANQLVITPWDRGLLGAIEAALRDSGRNFNPINDGQLIRLIIPAMTQERRDELVKLVGKMAEETRIALRNLRKEGREAAQAQAKRGELNEDLLASAEKELDRLTEQMNQAVETLVARKTEEVRTI